jgi:dTDP-4-dehydrorhamnose reductase
MGTNTLRIKNKEMKILVTGSNGLLGQKLSELIQNQPGMKLIATARGKSSLNLEHAEYYSLDSMLDRKCPCRGKYCSRL